MSNRTPFQCCGQSVPIEACSRARLDFILAYTLIVLERTTPSPVYCSDRMCSRFLPPSQYQDPDSAVCVACGQITCRLCRGPEHREGVCAQDTQLQEARRFAERSGWKACPRCQNVVEKRSGCNHMTCRCGGQVCYLCGGVWGHWRHRVT